MSGARRAPWPAPGILRAELLRVLRAPAAARAAACTVIGATVVLALAWPDPAEAAGVRAARAQTVFRSLLVAEVLLVGVLAPVLVAGALAGEREHDTWDLLRTTALRTGDWLVAKALAALALVGGLALLALPLWSGCLLLGAVEGWQFVGAGLLLAGEAAWLAGAAVWAAARFHRVFAASLVSLGLALPALAATVGLGAAIGDVGGAPIACGALAGVLGLGGGALWLVAAHRATEARMAALDRPPATVHRSPPAAAPGRADQPRFGLGLRRDRFPDRLLMRPLATRSWPDGADAFYLREAAAGVEGIGGAAIRGVVVVGAMAIMVTTLASAASGRASLALVVALAGSIAAAIAAAQALPSEAARGTLEVLRLVPGATRRLPWSHARAAARLGFGVAAALGLVALPGFVLHALVISSAHESRGIGLGVALLALGGEAILIAGVVWLGVGIGAWAAGSVRSTTGALMAAILGLLLAVAGPAVTGRALERGASARRQWRYAEDFMGWTESRGQELRAAGWWVARALSTLDATEPSGWHYQQSAQGWVALRTGDRYPSGPSPARLAGTAALLALLGTALALAGARRARRRLDAA